MSADESNLARLDQDVTIRSGFRSRSPSLVPWACLLAVWGVAIAAGSVVLEAYARSPGAAGRALSDWPRGTVIPLDHRHPTLLIFLHPLCPCSSASVDELEELVGRSGDRVGLHAVLLRTASFPTDGSGKVERSLVNVPGMKIWQDMDGAETRRFGVLTSGHVLLYEPGGRLIFSGGITRSRGHRGDNFGRSPLLAAIDGERIDRGSIPVFGCPLFDFQRARTVEAHR
jgi:hypothetical protein